MKIIYFLCIYAILYCIYYIESCSSEPFLEPKVLSAHEESFVLNDLEYIFTNQRATWEEAEIGCSAVESGSLALVDNMEKANFLALALSETDLVLEDLWVGASIQECKLKCINQTAKLNCSTTKMCFKWLSGEVVNDSLILTRYHEVKLTVRECLSFARNFHQEPSLVDLACGLRRPYMCQRPAYEDEGEMTHQGWIQIGHYEYAIFYDKKTWKESVRECFSKHKAHLADFREMKEVAGIGKYLLTGRPSLENAWIGGYFKSGKWRYVSINDIIPMEKDPTTLYPPWPETNETLPKEGCLLLDRHLDDGKKLIFLQARCHRKKSYICSRRIGDKAFPPYEIIIIDDVCYTLFYSPKTWFEANQTCHGRKAWLVEVTEEKLDNVIYIMGENRTEINHIWIGGKLDRDNKWYWVTSNESIETDQNEIFNGYPPWLDDIFDQKYACLNMDRENHNKALFYGVYCYAKQPFICQQYDIEISTNEPTSTKELIETTTTQPTTNPDIWKWKWPTQKNEYNRIKPFFNWTVDQINRDKKKQ